MWLGIFLNLVFTIVIISRSDVKFDYATENSYVPASFNDLSWNVYLLVKMLKTYNMLGW